jgi:hypothetical protein
MPKSMTRLASMNRFSYLTYKTQTSKWKMSTLTRARDTRIDPIQTGIVYQDGSTR